MESVHVRASTWIIIRPPRRCSTKDKLANSVSPKRSRAYRLILDVKMGKRLSTSWAVTCQMSARTAMLEVRNKDASGQHGSMNRLGLAGAKRRGVSSMGVVRVCLYIYTHNMHTILVLIVDTCFMYCNLPQNPSRTAKFGTPANRGT